MSHFYPIDNFDLPFLFEEKERQDSFFVFDSTPLTYEPSNNLTPGNPYLDFQAPSSEYGIDLETPGNPDTTPGQSNAENCEGNGQPQTDQVQNFYQYSFPEGYTPGGPDSEPIEGEDLLLDEPLRLISGYEEAPQDLAPFDKDVCFQNFLNTNIPMNPQEEKPKQMITIIIEIDDAFYANTNRNNDHNRDESECEKTVTEEIASLTTKADTYAGVTTFDYETSSVAESLFGESHVRVELEWKTHIENYVSTKSDEERAYIKEVLPHLIESLQEASLVYNTTLNQRIFEAIIQNLLHERELNITTENKILKKMIQKEMDEIASYRPKEIIDYEDLCETKRKTKKAIKGNKNNSSMNHMNENYVSNIFQFSKQNYPADKEIQRIANTRNVSASNFKKLTRINLKDGLLVRKAKVRILACGRELVNNVEFWMNDGYFSQCTEREKYIKNKEKALSDLVLEKEF